MIGYFGDPVIVNLTQEFMSPDFHQLLGRVFLLVVLLIVTGLALSPRPPATSHLLVLLANLAFALHSARNIELFGLTAVPLMALHFDPDWRRLGPLPRVRAAFATEAGARRRGVPAAVAAVLLAALGLAHGRVAGVQVIPDRFDDRQFPVAAVAAARAGGLAGRLYTEFTWNGYVLLAWPEQRVFIDPGTDHYGPELSRDEIRLWNLESGWDRVIERWGIRNMLLPATSRLAYQLARDDGWFVWYQDEVAVILRRLHDSATPSRISEAVVPCRPAT